MRVVRLEHWSRGVLACGCIKISEMLRDALETCILGSSRGSGDQIIEALLVSYATPYPRLTDGGERRNFLLASRCRNGKAFHEQPRCSGDQAASP